MLMNSPHTTSNNSFSRCTWYIFPIINVMTKTGWTWVIRFTTDRETPQPNEGEAYCASVGFIYYIMLSQGSKCSCGINKYMMMSLCDTLIQIYYRALFTLAALSAAHIKSWHWASVLTQFDFSLLSARIKRDDIIATCAQSNFLSISAVHFAPRLYALLREDAMQKWTSYWKCVLNMWNTSVTSGTWKKAERLCLFFTPLMYIISISPVRPPSRECKIPNRVHDPLYLLMRVVRERRDPRFNY